nr:putative phasin family protein [uncultured bacterium]
MPKKIDDTIKAEAPIKDETVKAAAETMAEAGTKATTKVVNGAREFVRRSASSAKERSDDMLETTEKFNSGLESVLTRAAGGYVSLLGGIASATHDNFNRALTTMEKLAGATSVSEAVRIQADYVRDNTTANLTLVREAADNVREVSTEGYDAVRKNVSKVWPYGKKAA